jgi:hypothetical protein
MIRERKLRCIASDKAKATKWPGLRLEVWVRVKALAGLKQIAGVEVEANGMASLEKIHGMEMTAKTAT